MTNSSHSTQVPMSKESPLYRPLTPRKPVLDGSHQKTSPDAFHHYCSSRCDTVRFLIIVLDLPSNLTRQECLQGGRIELILDRRFPDRPHDSPLSDHAGFQVHGDLSLDTDGCLRTSLSTPGNQQCCCRKDCFLPASSSQASKRLRQPPVRSLMVKFHFDQVVRVARTVPTSKKMDLFF